MPVQYHVMFLFVEILANVYLENFWRKAPGWTACVLLFK